MRVCFEVEITGEGVQSNLLYLMNIDTWAETCSWPCGYAFHSHQKVVTLDVYDTENTMAVKRIGSLLQIFPRGLLAKDLAFFGLLNHEAGFAARH